MRVLLAALVVTALIATTGAATAAAPAKKPDKRCTLLSSRAADGVVRGNGRKLVSITLEAAGPMDRKPPGGQDLLLKVRAKAGLRLCSVLLWTLANADDHRTDIKVTPATPRTATKRFRHQRPDDAVFVVVYSRRV